MEKNYEKLFEALRSSSDINIITQLLKLVNLDEIDKYWPAGDPPLVLAAKHCRDINILKAIINKNCHINATSSTGETALHCVTSLWELDSVLDGVKILLEAGSNPNLIDNLTRQIPLHTLSKRCGNGNKKLGNTSERLIEAFKCLVDAKSDINAKDNKNKTALHTLAYFHCTNSEPYKILLENGADIGIQNDRGEIPLAEAVENGNIFAAETILKYVKEKLLNNNNDNWLLKSTIYGETALHIAARKDYITVVQLILDINKNSQVTACKDLNGDTALHLAAGRGHAEVVQSLISNRLVDINAKNRKGLTPLHVAVESGFISVVKILLEKPSCDMMAVTSDGRKSSVYDLAQHEYRRRSQPEMSLFLLREAERRNINYIH